MKISISLPVSSRPDFLKKMLKSLKKSFEKAPDEFKKHFVGIVVFCEPFPKCISIIREIDWIPTFVVENTSKLGVRHNPYECIDATFNNNTNINVLSDFNIHLEDDLEFSDYFFHLMWYYAQNVVKWNDVLVYGGYVDKGDYKKHNEAASHTNPNVFRVNRSYKFHGLGWATTKDAWNDHLKSIWFKDLNENRKIGWDWTFCEYLSGPSYCEIIPSFSHTKHIGWNGTHVRDKRWNERTFGYIQWNALKPIDSSSIVPFSFSLF